MLGKERKREQIFEAMQLARLEQVFLYPTKTGLEKSIFDATRAISQYFREVGYHDYHSQLRGPEHKKKLQCKVICGSEIINSNISLYRPNTKDGDYRFWISYIDKYSEPGDMIALFVRQEILFAANMSVTSIEDLVQFLPVDAKGTEILFSYDQVNHSINKFIVSGQFIDKPLYLDFDGAFAQNISEYLNVEMEQLSELIFNLAKQRLCFEKSNPFSELDKENDAWWAGKFSSLPPITLFLFALTLVAEQMSSDDTHSLNNYYDRLIKCFGISNDTDNKAVRAHFKSTEKYWLNFNSWLVRNDGQYGIATAKPIIAKWKYVSYPISQAILRRGDKENIRQFLSERKLDNETEIEISQLADLLDRWLSSSASTKYLRDLWERQDLRQLIVETSREQLTSIQPEQDQVNRAKSLRLGLRISNFPIQSLHAFIYSNQNFNDEVQNVNRLKGSAVFGDVNLTKIEENLSIFGPPENISIESLLLSGIEISTNDEQSFSYKPKQIFALQRSEHGYFLQVDRPRVLEDYVLIGMERNNLKNQTKSFLSFCAAQGYEFKEDVRGLPAGFFFVENVKFVRSVNENQWPFDDPNYYIRPSGSLSLLSFSNAIRLGRNILHTESAPTFSFTFEGEEAGEVEINLISEETKEAEIQKIDPSISGPVAEFELNELLELDVNTEIKLVSLNGAFPETRFSFRNSSQPRLESPPEQQYALQFEHPHKFLGCDEVTEAVDWTLLRDWSFQNLQEDDDTNIGLTTNTEYLGPQSQAEHLVDEENIFQYSKGQASPVSSSEQLSCMLGQHIWRIPSESSDGKWEATCSACGEERLFPVHKKFRQNSDLKRKIVYSNNSIYAPICLKTPKTVYNPDVILDAIHYLQELSFSRFVEMCREISNENLFSFELLNAFWILGEVDCSLDPRSLKPAKIFSAAPTLFQVDGGYVLRGFKNRELIVKLTEILGPPEIDKKRFSGNPTTTYFFSSILRDNLKDELLNISDVFGRKLVLSENFGELLVKQLFNFSSLFPFLPPLSVSLDSNLEFFDSVQAKWKKITNFSDPGSYRINWPFRQYFLVLEDKKTVACGADLAKIYSGHLNGVRYHRYEKQDCSFVSNLGCELPPLIQRSLVSFSGQMPTADNEGKKIFTNVPEKVAMTLINRVYS